ncbi:MAG: hypothetical protein K5739_06150 [Lachnospiraceae bacterium]|nr:hypothetical protein [Lachnospiraceae bacterium]
MKKKRIVQLQIASLLLLLTACGDAIPEMSEQQTEMFTEYAAGSVLDATGASSSRLVDTSVPFEPEKMSKYEKEKLGISDEEYPMIPPKEGEDAEDASETAEDGEESGEGEKEKPAKEEPAMSAQEVLGTEGFSYEVTGFSVVDKYPEDAQDFMLSVDATAGNKLLIANIKVTNTTTVDSVLDFVARKDLHFRFLINGDQSVDTMLTLLPNDLSVIKESIGAGSSYDAVLIAQMPEGEAAAVSELFVEVRSDAGKALLK